MKRSTIRIILIAAISLCVFAAQAGNVNTVSMPDAVAPLIYAEKPLWEVSTVRPSFWIRDEQTGKTAEADVRYEHGIVKIYGLRPGEYGLQVRVDANPDTPEEYPGDLGTFHRFKVVAGDMAQFTVTLSRRMHLTQPVDNARLLPDFDRECRSKSEYGNKLRFEWDPVQEAEKYYYKIMRGTCSPFTSGDIVKSGYTASPYVDLTATGYNEYYSFSLLARRGGDTVGRIMVHGRRGHGWDYRFRVK